MPLLKKTSKNPSYVPQRQILFYKFRLLSRDILLFEKLWRLGWIVQQIPIAIFRAYFSLFLNHACDSLTHSYDGTGPSELGHMINQRCCSANVWPGQSSVEISLNSWKPYEPFLLQWGDMGSWWMCAQMGRYSGVGMMWTNCEIHSDSGILGSFLWAGTAPNWFWWHWKLPNTSLTSSSSRSFWENSKSLRFITEINIKTTLSKCNKQSTQLSPSRNETKLCNQQEIVGGQRMGSSTKNGLQQWLSNWAMTC